MQRWSRFSLALPVLVLAACSDNPVASGPSGEIARFSTSGSGSGLRQAISNSIKYSDEGQKPSTGRSGAASLIARALMNKNGDVDLEMTTGTLADLEAGWGPGNLDKVQLKMFEPSGNNISTVNYNKLKNGGYALYSLQGLVRGGGVQVQANVSGIDPTRMDVVTVTDLVKLRPDLSVQSLTAPERARVQMPVNISAAVVERNGDVGANADCVLSVDGTEVDRAAGIWVDAGDVVTCSFTHTFTSVGTKALEVAVTKVIPGDYDLSNNTVSGTIEITSGNQFVNFGGAEDVDHASSGREAWLYDYGTFGGERSRTWDDRGWTQTAWMFSEIPRAMTFPIRAEVRQWSAGVEALDQAYEFGVADWQYETRSPNGDYRIQACAITDVLSSSAAFVRLNLCTIRGIQAGTAFGWTNLEQTRNAGEVTYYSRGYSITWYRSDGNVYSQNVSLDNDDVQVTGTVRVPMAAGTDYAFETVLTAGGESFTAALPVRLSSFDRSRTTPYACRPLTGGYTCREEIYVYKGVSGNGDNEPTP